MMMLFSCEKQPVMPDWPWDDPDKPEQPEPDRGLKNLNQDLVSLTRSLPRLARTAMCG